MKTAIAKTDNQLLTAQPGARSPLENRAIGRLLNGFFANSVNSPPRGMVNFSCCVRSFPDVTREVAAQPMRSAVRMESGVHAGV